MRFAIRIMLGLSLLSPIGSTLFCLTLSSMFLSGCSPEGQRRAGKALDRAATNIYQGATDDDKIAIQAVGRKLQEAKKASQDNYIKNYDRGSAGGDPSPDEEKAMYEFDYRYTLDIDTSSCPSEFRSQYRLFLKSQLALIQNFRENEPEAQFLQDEENVVHQKMELKSIAHRYGADQDFDYK